MESDEIVGIKGIIGNSRIHYLFTLHGTWAALVRIVIDFYLLGDRSIKWSNTWGGWGAQERFVIDTGVQPHDTMLRFAVTFNGRKQLKHKLEGNN